MVYVLHLKYHSCYLLVAGFYINLPIGGLVAILLVFTRVPEQRKKSPALEVLPTFYKTFDLVGFVLFAPAAIMFLLALEWGGNEYAWNDSRIIGLFCGAGATAIVFLGWEYYKGRDAMIPFHLITQRVAYASYANVAVIFGLTMVIAYYLPIYFQAVKDDSALISGVNLLPQILSQLVASVISGVLSMLIPSFAICLFYLLTVNQLESWATISPGRSAVQLLLPLAPVSSQLLHLQLQQPHGQAIKSWLVSAEAAQHKQYVSSPPL